MKNSEENYIGWLKLYNRLNLSEVGLKNAVLGEMKQSGFPVPPGFFLTAEAFKELLEYNNMKDRIHGILSGLNPDQAEAVDQASRDIRKMIEFNGMPSELESLIIDRYRFFSQHHSQETEMPVSVRPSPVIQDRAHMFLAGLFDSLPWVKGVDVPPSVLKCWMSLFSPMALKICLISGIDIGKVSMSVCIQQFVNIKSAGSLITVNREDQDATKIGIEGNWGIGGRPFAGDDEGDHWLLDKSTLEILQSDIRAKKRERIIDPERGALLQVEVEPDRQTTPCLNRDEVVEIAKLGRAIELHFGKVEEIEWAVEMNSQFPENIFLLQCRLGDT
jgi:pyruvate, water dikinase